MMDNSDKKKFKRFSRLRTKFEITKAFISYLLVFLVLYLKTVGDMVLNEPKELWLKMSFFAAALSFIFLTISVLIEIRGKTIFEEIMLSKVRKKTDPIYGNTNVFDKEDVKNRHDIIRNFFWNNLSETERIEILDGTEDLMSILRHINKIENFGYFAFSFSLLLLCIHFY